MRYSSIADEEDIDERYVEAIRRVVEEGVIVKKPLKRTYKQRKKLKNGGEGVYVRSDYYIPLPSSASDTDEHFIVLAYATLDRLLNLLEMYNIPADVFSLILAEIFSELY